nr:hypothetical protein [uncultured Draconibacterium sp.]
MRTFKKILSLIILMFTIQVYGIEKININNLVPIAEKYGIDSALILSRGLPIYKIDSTIAINLLDYVIKYERYSKTEYFFNQMAHNWNNKSLKDKTEKFLETQLDEVIKSEPNKYGNIPILDDKLIISILKQKPDSAEENLIKAYKTLNLKADFVKENYPSRITLFFQYFKGTPPIIECYEDYHESCYKIMWTLGELNSKFYNKKELAYHKSQLVRWKRNFDINQYSENYSEYDSHTITLINPIKNIQDLDFEKEPSLKDFEVFSRDKCWIILLSNDKIGFLDAGCQFAPLAGNGATYKLELLKDNKLKISVISEWIS